MKIYTKTGDSGLTSLLTNERVHKSDPRIDAYGTVDELNAYMGVLKDQPVNKSRIQTLEEIQSCLFVIGSMVAANGRYPNGMPKLQESSITFLEKSIDAIQQNLPPLRSFIIPGGHLSVSFGHVARTVCRRAERAVVALHQDREPVEPLILQYLNRLSDYLFVLCRQMASELEVTESPWRGSVS